MHDAVIRQGSRVERSILDKEAIVGENAVIGGGNAKKPNARFPDHLYSGLTLIGKKASIPPNAQIGTNCIIFPMIGENDLPCLNLADGGTVEK